MEELEKFINRQNLNSLDEDCLREMFKEYATECVKASLDKASDNAEVIQDWGECNINTESITDPENIVLL